MKMLRYIFWLICVSGLCHPITVMAQPAQSGVETNQTLTPQLQASRVVVSQTFTRISLASSTPPLRTAEQSLFGFLKDGCGCRSIEVSSDGADEPRLVTGTIYLGTTTENPLLARLLKEGRLTLCGSKTAGDAYEIVAIDGSVVVNGATSRAVLYGVYELQDVIAEHGGVPADLAVRGTPSLELRVLHPRVRGGFGGYRQSDFEFISRCGANVAHLTHDWMAEKTFFSFVPSTEFPHATDPAVLERNRKRLRQYLDWCALYGLDSALWLCEMPCQGGPWLAESQRHAFLDRYPAECLSDSGTHQGKVLCLAHPLVEQAYRQAIRQFFVDFPEISMMLVFTLDSSGELCDPATCPRHRNVSKLTQYNRLLALMLQEGRTVRAGLRVLSVGWGWQLRGEPDYLSQQSALPAGAGLATLPDAEAWSFDRKLTDDLIAARAWTRKQGQLFLGYDIFFWGDDTVFPQTRLYDFPLGIAAKLRRWRMLGADGVFDQWGTQAEYMPCNATAFRELVFHSQFAEPGRVDAWARSLAARRFGAAAAPHVVAAWQEIEAAQQIQSDHTFYWHHLRPNWAGPTLKCPLTVEALQAVTLQGAEPPKRHGLRDYAPFRDDISRARALGPALQHAADHFAKAVAQLEAALRVIPADERIALGHWHMPEAGAEARLTPAGLIEQQILAVSLQEKTQRRMGLFFKAYALVKSLPPQGTPLHEEAMAELQRLRAENEKAKP